MLTVSMAGSQLPTAPGGPSLTAARPARVTIQAIRRGPGRDEHLDHPVDCALATRAYSPPELAALAADGVLKVAALRRGHRTSPSRARRCLAYIDALKSFGT